MLNQLVRYEAVVGLLGRDGGRLADIGSGSVGLAAWVGPEWTVTAVDQDFSDYGSTPAATSATLSEQVHADARRLPFDDGHFDATVALDLIEHIHPADRDAVIAELARVTRRLLVVGCPAGEEAIDADRRLLDRYRERELEVPGWLVEHVEHGFPDSAELRAWLEPHGEVELIANESVAAHARISRFELTPRGVRRSVALARPLRSMIRAGGAARRICAALVRNLLRGRDRRPSYRTIAVVRRR